MRNLTDYEKKTAGNTRSPARTSRTLDSARPGQPPPAVHGRRAPRARRRRNRRRPHHQGSSSRRNPGRRQHRHQLHHPGTQAALVTGPDRVQTAAAWASASGRYPSSSATAPAPAGSAGPVRAARERQRLLFGEHLHLDAGPQVRHRPPVAGDQHPRRTVRRDERPQHTITQRPPDLRRSGAASTRS